MTQAQSAMKGPLRLVFGVVKAACILAGLPVTVVCLMALVGLLTDNIWARGVGALVVAIGLPLLAVDRLLPEDDQQRSRGMPTDMLSVFYVAFPLVFIGLAHSATGGMLAREADRLHVQGLGSVSAVTYWLAGARPVTATATTGTTTARKGKAKGSARPAGKAPTPDAGAGAAKKKKLPDAAAASKKPDAKAGPGARKKYTPADLFRTCSPSVVSIEVVKSYSKGGGTGFIIDNEGTVATNSHVIHKASSVQVKLKDGTWIKEVDLLMEDKKADLALLRLKTDKTLTPVTMGDSDKVTVGEQVISIGNPLGLDYTLTDGLVSARRKMNGRKWIQMSAPVSPGNSGGPLFNMYGEVIGVTTQVMSWYRGAQNLNLAVPINELKKRIKESYPDRKSIGAGEKSGTW